MKAIFKTNTFFLFPYFIFIVLGAFLLLLNTKIELHLTFNSFHNRFFDTCFTYITYLGDGVIVVLSLVILCAVKYRYAIIVGLSNFIASLITQVLKQTIYADVVRPKKFFEGIHELYLVPDVENHLYNSFPSGHTTCAFSLYLALAFITENKFLKLFLFTIALLTGYSRIYLSQHFFEDVYAGSIIGVSVTLVVYYFIQKTNRSFMDRSLVNLFKD